MYIYHIFTHNSNFQNPHFSMWKENLHKIIEIFNPLNVLEKYIWYSNFMKCDIGSAKCWPKNEKLIFKSDVCDDVYLILKDSTLSLLSVSCCPHFLPKPAEGADFSGVLRPVKIEKKSLLEPQRCLSAFYPDDAHRCSIWKWILSYVSNTPRKTYAPNWSRVAHTVRL